MTLAGLKMKKINKNSNKTFFNFLFLDPIGKKYKNRIFWFLCWNFMKYNENKGPTWSCWLKTLNGHIYKFFNAIWLFLQEFKDLRGLACRTTPSGHF
jgi:hypothetical protein